MLCRVIHVLLPVVVLLWAGLPVCCLGRKDLRYWRIGSDDIGPRQGQKMIIRNHNGGIVDCNGVGENVKLHREYDDDDADLWTISEDTWVGVRVWLFFNEQYSCYLGSSQGNNQKLRCYTETASSSDLDRMHNRWTMDEKWSNSDSGAQYRRIWLRMKSLGSPACIDGRDIDRDIVDLQSCRNKVRQYFQFEWVQQGSFANHVSNRREVAVVSSASQDPSNMHYPYLQAGYTVAIRSFYSYIATATGGNIDDFVVNEDRYYGDKSAWSVEVTSGNFVFYNLEYNCWLTQLPNNGYVVCHPDLNIAGQWTLVEAGSSESSSAQFGHEWLRLKNVYNQRCLAIDDDGIMGLNVAMPMRSDKYCSSEATKFAFEVLSQ